MNRLEITEQLDESLEASSVDDQKPSKINHASSTRYSQTTRSKFLLHNDAESISHSSALREPTFNSKRKEQNKESAKKCRMKKKELCLELEEREKKLQEELLRLQNENSKAKEELDKFVSGNNVPNIFNNIGRAEAYERLNKIIESEQIVDQDEINLILDNLKYRVGAAGTERQSKITYIFKQVIHICFPALHRYLMWTASNSTQYFGNNPSETNWMQNLDSVLNLTPDQKQIIRNRKPQFAESYQTFSDLIDQMKETKIKLQKQSAVLEQLIQNLRHLLNPTQCVKLITFIQNNKYRSQMELWVKNNMRKFSDQEDSPAAKDPGICKVLKIQRI